MHALGEQLGAGMWEAFLLSPKRSHYQMSVDQKIKVFVEPVLWNITCISKNDFVLLMRQYIIEVTPAYPGCLQIVRGGVQEWSKWVRFFSRLSQRWWFWKRKKGQFHTWYRCLNFFFFSHRLELKSSSGRKYANDWLRRQWRCLLKLGFVERDKRPTWGLIDVFYSSENSCLELKPAFRYLKQVAGLWLTGNGLGR